MARRPQAAAQEPILAIGANMLSPKEPFPQGVYVRSRRGITLKFEYQGKTCRETVRLRPTESNIRDMGVWLVTIRDSIARGTFNYETTFPNSKRMKKLAAVEIQANKTCGELLDDWLAGRRSIKVNTRIEYEKAINGQLRPRFGDLPIGELTDSVINKYRDELRNQGLSLSRISNVLIPLRGAVGRAMKLRCIESNPFDLVDALREDGARPVDPDAEGESAELTVDFDEPLPDENLVPTTDTEGQPDPFTPAEREAILAQMGGQVRNFYALSFWTGLRTGEAIALCWCDIDWARLRVCVRRTKKGKVISTPKTKAGIRWVPLSAPALAALRSQEAFTREEGSFVFHNPRTGRVWSSDNKTRAYWDTALEAAGIRYRWQYQTRHTFASTLLSAGENPLYVAEILGHKDWHQLVQSYGRWIPEVNGAAGSQVAKVCEDEWRRTVALLDSPAGVTTESQQPNTGRVAE